MKKYYFRNPYLLQGLVLALGLATSGFSDELPETYTGVRPLGMGKAFTAVANDENSVWTNPAGVTRVRKARSRKTFSLINFPTVIGGGNDGGKSFLLNMLGKSTSKGPEVLEGILSNLDSNKSEAIWVRTGTSAMAFFDVPKGSPWVLGAFSNAKTWISPESDTSESSLPEDTVVFIDNVTDVGGLLTLAWTNRTNRINFALQLRPTMRYGYYDKTTLGLLLSEFKTKIREDGNSGFGLGLDAGFMWTLADYWFPTIGLAIKNLPTGCIDEYLNPFAEVRQKVCGTKYSGTVNNPESPTLLDPMDLRLGLSMTPRLGRKIALRFAVDLHHLYITPDNVTYYGLSGVEPLKQVHAGVELFVGNPLLINPFSIRVGFNQGFLTFGGTFRVGLLALEAAMFQQDVSSSASGEKDERYVASLTLEFN